MPYIQQSDKIVQQQNENMKQANRQILLISFFYLILYKQIQKASKVTEMNILSHEQMRQKEKKLLLLYNQGESRFKLDLEELIQAKEKRRDVFCFKKADNMVKIWIQKLVPLNKRVQILSLQEQQNGLFKVLAFIFLFIIYKRKSQPNQYVREQIKCSLYSDDVDLLQTRNHSFNKKMKSDTVKSVMAVFFKQIQYLAGTDLLIKNRIKPEQLILVALQKNDLVVEGFHLFFRNILSKLQVQNANNCTEQVSAAQAISNLIQYFQVDCRTFNDLFLFHESGVFIAQIEGNNLVFGKYYENQLEHQQTSQEEGQHINKQNPQSQLDLKSKPFLKQALIQKQDLKIFNFILDADVIQSQSQENLFSTKNNQAETPCFTANQELKFRRKKSVCQPKKQHDNTFIKLKDRLHSQRINEIQSQEQNLQRKTQCGTLLLNSPQSNMIEQNQGNRFLNFQVQKDDEDQYDEYDQAPTPKLGGPQLFNFGNRTQKISKTQIIENNGIKTGLPNKEKQTRQLSVRRQSYQGNNSSRSKGSRSKKVVNKQGKNKIQVIDQTSSRMSLFNLNQLTKKHSDEYIYQRKQTNGFIQKMSSFSNCTCNLQKKNRIKLNSQIIQVVVQSKDTRNNENAPNLLLRFGARQSPFPTNGANQNKLFLFESNNTHSRGNMKSQKQVVKHRVEQVNDPRKRQQFLSFLKKDKSELIKKLTQKRHTKNISMQDEQQKYQSTQNRNVYKNRTFIKQSMFVGTYQFNNPEKNMRGKDQRTITPATSIDKKMLRERRKRSITPTNNHLKVFNIGNEIRMFKEDLTSKKRPAQMTCMDNDLFNQSPSKNQRQRFPAVNAQKHQISFRVPDKAITHSIGYTVPISVDTKPYQFYARR